MRNPLLAMPILASSILACVRPAPTCDTVEVERPPEPEHVDRLLELVTKIETNRSEVMGIIEKTQDELRAGDGQAAAATIADIDMVIIKLDPLFERALLDFDTALLAELFELAWLSHVVQLNAAILRGWVRATQAVLSAQATGPSNFVVVDSAMGGAVLAEFVTAICDTVPKQIPVDFDPAKLQRCEGEQTLQADAFVVRSQIDGPTQVVSAREAKLLLPTGPIYTYAIGATPEANAKAWFDIMLRSIQQHSGRMVELHASIQSSV